MNQPDLTETDIPAPSTGLTQIADPWGKAVPSPSVTVGSAGMVATQPDGTMTFIPWAVQSNPAAALSSAFTTDEAAETARRARIEQDYEDQMADRYRAEQENNLNLENQALIKYNLSNY